MIVTSSASMKTDTVSLTIDRTLLSRLEQTFLSSCMLFPRLQGSEKEAKEAGKQCKVIAIQRAEQPMSIQHLMYSFLNVDSRILGRK